MIENKQQIAAWSALVIALIPFVQKNVFDRIWPPYEDAVKSAEKSTDGVRQAVLSMYGDMLQPKIDAITDKIDDTNKRIYRLENTIIDNTPSKTIIHISSDNDKIASKPETFDVNTHSALPTIDDKESKEIKQQEKIIKRQKNDWQSPLPNVEMLQQQMSLPNQSLN